MEIPTSIATEARYHHAMKVHKDTFTHTFYTQMRLHTDAFTHRHSYTQALLHTAAFTQRPLWKGRCQESRRTATLKENGQTKH